MFDFILWILAQIRHSAIVMSQHRDMGPISLFFFFFLWLHLQHMEVSGARGRIGAVAAGLSHSQITPDPSHTWGLCHSL